MDSGVAISTIFPFQVRRYRSEVSSLQTSLNRARVERMSSSLGAGPSSGARQSSSAGGGGGPVTDQYRQQVGHSNEDGVTEGPAGSGGDRDTLEDRGESE